MEFIPVMAQLNFKQPLLQSSMSHDLLEIFQYFLINRKFSIYLKLFFFNIINVFTVTFDYFNASMQNRSIFLLKITDPKLLNNSVILYSHLELSDVC